MKELNLFTQNDLRRIKKLGLTPLDAEKQMESYRHGSNYLNLNRPCAINDGILSIQKTEMDELIKLYEREAGKFKLLKFVPASGAASRMFAEWFSALEKDGFGSPSLNQSFLRNLKKYPFYSLIKQNKRASEFIEKKNIKGLLDYILSAKGLNFGWLPKALIPQERRVPLWKNICLRLFNMFEAQAMFAICISRFLRNIKKMLLKKLKL